MSNPFMPKSGGTAPLRPANSASIAEEFQQFAQNFRGNPKQEVDRLLSSGQMSQQQLDFLVGEVQRRFPFFNTGGMRR